MLALSQIYYFSNNRRMFAKSCSNATPPKSYSLSVWDTLAHVAVLFRGFLWVPQGGSGSPDCEANVLWIRGGGGLFETSSCSPVTPDLWPRKTCKVALFFTQ